MFDRKQHGIHKALSLIAMHASPLFTPGLQNVLNHAIVIASPIARELEKTVKIGEGFFFPTHFDQFWEDNCGAY